MLLIRFAPWEPDKADLDASVTRIARNVLPAANSYKPLRSLAPYNDTAMAGDARGLAATRLVSGGWNVWTGSATKLYKFATSSWTDVSRTVGGNYAVPANEYWRFAQFGDNLVAVQGGDDPQVIGISGGANFAALGGSPPRARNVSVVGDFLVLSGLVNFPARLHWSDINTITSWTPGSGSFADFQDFPDGGRVVGVAGGEVGYVLQEYAIRRMTFVPGSGVAFQFERVIDGKGCLSPYGYATVGGVVYFVGEDGFYAYSGGGLNPIGGERVNQWFLDNCDTTRLTGVLCVADPYRPLILWAFYATAASTVFDRLLIYNWQLDRWTFADVSAQMWASGAAPGIGLDSLTTPLDSLPYSLDSRAYEGGRPVLMAIDTSRRLAFMEGANLAATIETQEAHIIPGKRSFVSEVRPTVDASAATVRVTTRERYADMATYSASASMEATGVCPVLASGRLMRAEVTIPAGVAWSNAVGVDVTAVPDGDA